MNPSQAATTLVELYFCSIYSKTFHKPRCYWLWPAQAGVNGPISSQQSQQHIMIETNWSIRQNLDDGADA